MSEQEILRYQEMLAKDPKSRAFAPLAELYRKMARLDDAIETAQNGLKHHPAYPGGLVVLGRALFEKGDLEQAAEIMFKAVKEAPENYLAQKWLGKILMAKGDVEKALRAMEAASMLSPDDQEVAADMAKLRAKVAPPETITFESTPGAERSEFTHQAKAAPSEPPPVEDLQPEVPVEAKEGVAEIDLDELSEIEELSEFEVSLAEEDSGVNEDGAAQEVYVPEEDLAALEDLEELVPIQDVPEQAPPEDDTATPGGFPIAAEGEQGSEAGPVMVSEEVSFGPDSALLEFPEVPVTAGLELGEHGGGHGSTAPEPETAPSEGTAAQPSSVSTSAEGISTETLADLYAQQGFTDKAIQIYRTLLEKRPGDEGLLAKLSALELPPEPVEEPVPVREGRAVQAPAGPPPPQGPSAKDPVKELEGWLANLERMKKR